jgi:hypothetical protein
MVDRFDETLVYLKNMLGWHNIFYGVRNQTTDRPLREQMPANTLNVIERHNQIDIDLYEYARNVFGKKIADEGNEFRKQVSRFRLMNKPYSAVFAAGRYLKHGLNNQLLKSRG